MISNLVSKFECAGTIYTLAVAEDWYNQQVAFEGIPWYRFASRPTTTDNAIARGASNDGMNIIVYDATGDMTGSKGNTLEQYTGVSKLKGALTPDGGKNYYLDVINELSQYIYANVVLPEYPSTGTLNTGHSAVGTRCDRKWCGSRLYVEGTPTTIW